MLPFSVLLFSPAFLLLFQVRYAFPCVLIFLDDDPVHGRERIDDSVKN